MTTLKGTVKWFNGKKGFGFIEREDKEKDAFVHASAVRAADLKFLNEGDKLEFTLEDGRKSKISAKMEIKELIKTAKVKKTTTKVKKSSKGKK